MFMPNLSLLSLFPVHWNSGTVARSIHLSAYLRAFPHKHHLPHQAVGTIQSSVPPPSTPPSGKHSSDYYHHKLVLPVLELCPFLCLAFTVQHISEIHLNCDVSDIIKCVFYLCSFSLFFLKKIPKEHLKINIGKMIAFSWSGYYLNHPRQVPTSR